MKLTPQAGCFVNTVLVCDFLRSKWWFKRGSLSQALATSNKNKDISKMIQNVLIRDEKRTDFAVISEVTIAAFETMEISNHTEQFIIEALRSAKALTISLVAEADGIVAGHIAFSPVIMSDGTKDWYGLGPVSVHPDFQRKGIGKALIQEGLSRLKNLKAKGCCLVGHPQYYRQFGFKNVEGLVHEGVPQEVFFALSFDGNIPQGNVLFHEGFKANG
jgi:putative acetyltransferase